MEINFQDENEFIRIANYNEKNTHGCWLYASCNLDKVTPERAIENIKNKFEYLLTKFKILRIILKKENEKLNWYYAKNKDLDFTKLISIVQPPNNEPPVIHPTEPLPLWRITLCSLNNETNIRIDINHAITDGRVIFDYLELFACVSNGENIPEKYNNIIKGYEPIPPLNINDYFEKNVFENYKIPESWTKAIYNKLNPEVSLPSHSICDSWELEYEPFIKFCEKFKVTLQGIVSASQVRAIWNYHNGKYDNMELGIYTPIDIRRLKYTKEKIKNGIFQYNISCVLPYMNKKPTILEQILHCQEQFKKSYDSYEGYHTYITLNNLMDEKTQNINYIKEFPDNSSKNIVFASHIGRVPDRKNIRFGLFMPVLEWGYWPNLYAFHNSKIICFTFERPYNVDKKYVDMVHDSIIEIYDFIKKNI